MNIDKQPDRSKKTAGHPVKSSFGAVQATVDGRSDLRLALGNRKTAGQRFADLRSGWCAARDSNPEPAD